ETRSGADGRYELTGAELGLTRVAALGPGVRDETVLELRSGETVTWNPIVAPAPAIFGTVIDPAGRPVAGREIEWFIGSERRLMRWTATDDQGRFAIPEADDVEHTLLVSDERGFPAAVARAVRPGSAPLELRIEDPTASAVLVLEAVGPDGAPAPGSFLRVDHRERELALEFSAVPGTGRFEIA